MGTANQPERPDDSAASSHTGFRSPRERVRAHMRVLLGRAALAGAGLALPSCILLPGTVYDLAPYPQTADCASDDSIMSATYGYASWQQTPSGLAAFVQLSLYADNLQFAGEVSVEGGTLSSPILETQELTAVLVPDDGATSVTITVPVSCGEANHTLTATLDVSAASPQESDYVPLQIGLQ